LSLPMGAAVGAGCVSGAAVAAWVAGADLENLANEAALLAARRDKKYLGREEFDEAELKVLAGPEKKSRVVTPHERRLTAYHEAGHAVVMRALPTHEPVHRITIVPRGQAGGLTIALPEEDRAYQSKQYMEEQIVSLLGGRVAEALMLGDVSTGASNDIQRASAIARKMVTVYGMSEKLGAVSFETGHDEIFIGREMARSKSYSEEVAAQIDAEVKRIVDGAYARCEDILKRDRARLVAVAEFLLRHETMSAEEFNAVFVQSDE
ncbi:MAG: ATP-dependent zinc metalloprotease FtsH, partial [Oscillospiraceae bacterium]|nr:ATP-dependent zinc metalloprotease FtsH [Oscillospiraceae bacterium]